MARLNRLAKRILIRDPREVNADLPTQGVPKAEARVDFHKLIETVTRILLIAIARGFIEPYPLNNA
jgi:hypothetical protein